MVSGVQIFAWRNRLCYNQSQHGLTHACNTPPALSIFLIVMLTKEASLSTRLDAPPHRTVRLFSARDVSYLDRTIRSREGRQ